jgi:hypothetical protein
MPISSLKSAFPVAGNLATGGRAKTRAVPLTFERYATASPTPLAFVKRFT